MAAVINYIPGAHPALIVTPSELLTRQVTRHLNEEFWTRIHGKPRGGPQQAEVFVPSTLTTVIAGNASVYVCTTNALQMLHEEYVSKKTDRRKEWADAFEALRDRVKLVIVDEGHREPAKEWAEAVRSLERPTLLFSATPYRNDYRFFRVGQKKGYSYSYRFYEAVNDHIIRDIAFASPKSPFGSDEKAFADALLDFYKHDKSLLAQTKNDDEKPKVIVRCSDVTSIRNVVVALTAKVGQDEVIGVHDAFIERGQFFPRVPHGHKATFWVHQFKLTEGLDDPSFRVVAFFQPFGNARSLVQQIGRVLRNPGKRANRLAFVFSNKADGLEKQWRGYIEFEKSGVEIISPEEIVRQFVKSLPAWFYFDREYRQAAQVVRGEESDIERAETEASLRDELRLALTAEVMRVPETFAAEDLERLVSETVAIYEGEELVQGIEPFIDRNGRRAVMLSWRVNQSEALQTPGFFEISLRPAVFYHVGQYLFHQGPVSIRDVIEEKGIGLVEPYELERVLDSKEAVTQVSLMNCDLGKSSVRRRSMGARSIGEVAPGLADHFHFVSSAKGSAGTSSRYVGLTRSRVSQTADEKAAIDDYCSWCDELAARMSRKRLKGPAVMQRYAQTVRPPADVRAKHLLIDLHDFFEKYGERSDGYEEGAGELYPERFESTACDVEDNGSFVCKIGARTINDGKVLYDREKKRFEITSDELNDMFREQTSNRRRKKSASAFLSQHASVRIITDEGDLYADRHFYHPRVPLWGDGRFEALGIFHPFAPLKKAVTEKGPEGKAAIDGDSWVRTSLFGVIDRRNELFALAEWPKKADLLICDDMGTEVGDFIAVSTEHDRIALIHAKTVTSALSAADFHIVNSQIVKNLELFNLGGTELPERRKRWDDPWSKRLRRIRRPRKKDAAWAFDRIEELLRKPNTEREVWAVVGPGLSIKNLVSQLQGPESPRYEVIQLCYLLQSCNATISSVGARFRLFAPP